MKRRLLPLLFLAAVQIGCSDVTSTVNLFNTDPMVDTRRDENGNTILLDTPKNWNVFISAWDFNIVEEAAGERPSGGRESWVKIWSGIFHRIRENHENAETYIDYIFERRRQAGLPELKLGDAATVMNGNQPKFSPRKPENWKAGKGLWIRSYPPMPTFVTSGSTSGSCCGVFDPYVNAEPDESGNWVFYDTPANRKFWLGISDAGVTQEAAGEIPPHGFETWDQRWQASIRAMRRSQVNVQYYIDYLIGKRLEKGLPPLTEE